MLSVMGGRKGRGEGGGVGGGGGKEKGWQKETDDLIAIKRNSNI